MRGLVLVWLLLLCSSHAVAQTPDEVPAQDASDSTATLSVGVYESPPFVIVDENDRFQGLAIDLWERIADERGWSFDYQNYSRDELLAATQQGDVDVAVGAINATGALAEAVDLSHPILSTGIGVAVRHEPDTLWAGLTRAIQRPIVPISGLGFLLLLALGVTVQRIRQTPALRYAWWVVSIALISTFFASLGTLLARGPIAHQIHTEDDLRRYTVVSVANSASEAWLASQEIPYRPAANVTEALDALHQGHADVVLYNRPALAWHAAHHQEDALHVLQLVIDRKDYALILPEQSPLRTPINTSMLDAIDSSDWPQYLDRYALLP